MDKRGEGERALWIVLSYAERHYNLRRSVWPLNSRAHFSLASKLRFQIQTRRLEETSINQKNTCESHSPGSALLDALSNGVFSRDEVAAFLAARSLLPTDDNDSIWFLADTQLGDNRVITCNADWQIPDSETAREDALNAGAGHIEERRVAESCSGHGHSLRLIRLCPPAWAE